jgi:hypothetical protein
VDLGISKTIAQHIAAAGINCIIRSDIFEEPGRENDLIEDSIQFEKGSGLVRNVED